MNRILTAFLIVIFALLGAFFFFGLVPKAPESNIDSGVTPVYGYKIVKSYPHDRKAFT